MSYIGKMNCAFVRKANRLPDVLRCSFNLVIDVDWRNDGSQNEPITASLIGIGAERETFVPRFIDVN